MCKITWKSRLWREGVHDLRGRIYSHKSCSKTFWASLGKFRQKSPQNCACFYTYESTSMNCCKSISGSIVILAHHQNDFNVNRQRLTVGTAHVLTVVHSKIIFKCFGYDCNFGCNMKHEKMDGSFLLWINVIYQQSGSNFAKWSDWKPDKVPRCALRTNLHEVLEYWNENWNATNSNN